MAELFKTCLWGFQQSFKIKDWPQCDILAKFSLSQRREEKYILKAKSFGKLQNLLCWNTTKQVVGEKKKLPYDLGKDIVGTVGFFFLSRLKKILATDYSNVSIIDILTL